MKESREVRVLLLLLLIVAAVVGVDFVRTLREEGRNHTWDPVPDPSMSRAMLIPPGSHIQGDPNAPYSLVAFTDLQCPACKSAQPILAAMMKKYGARCNLVSHHLLTHPKHVHAGYLACATEAAGMQGRYWEMRDLLLENQEHFERRSHAQAAAEVLRLARRLGLDLPRFQKDLAGPEVKAIYQREMALMQQARIYGVPGYFFVPPAGPPIRLKLASQIEPWMDDPAHWK